jgi:hypothetical protein
MPLAENLKLRKDIEAEGQLKESYFQVLSLLAFLVQKYKY